MLLIWLAGVTVNEEAQNVSVEPSKVAIRQNFGANLTSAYLAAMNAISLHHIMRYCRDTRIDYKLLRRIRSRGRLEILVKPISCYIAWGMRRGKGAANKIRKGRAIATARKSRPSAKQREYIIN